jgi:hypothetical protein
MSINLKCRVDLTSYIEGTFVMSNFSRSGKENCLVNGCFNKRLVFQMVRIVQHSDILNRIQLLI